MYKFLKFISNFVSKRNSINSKDAYLNLLDIGCSSFIPNHFVRFAEIINFLGCDPDLVGIQKVREMPYMYKFKTARFENVAASDITKKSFLEIADKRTGSQIRKEKNNNKNFIEIDLLKTSILQEKFSDGFANLIKIDAEGHELEVIKGINLNSDQLLCVEVECTLDQNNNNLSSIISLFENNNFFLATLRYHNQQTLNLSVFKNKFYKFIYKLFRRIPLLNSFNTFWTDLSGKVEFDSNKSFLSQIELVFLKRKQSVPKNYFKKYENILLIYGFIRHLSMLKPYSFLNFIVRHFPSR